MHLASSGVVWASGSQGTVLRSEDDGLLWQICAVPDGGGGLDFRGVWAWDANRALVMASGPGTQSRVYRTSDGCRSWSLAATNSESQGFWDALLFIDEQHGFVLGDPVRGSYQLLETRDGGQHWRTLTGPALAAHNGSGLFAASNSSAWVGAAGRLRFVTGGPELFVLLTTRLGAPATVVPLPLARGTAAGAFSLAFRDDRHAVVVGGNYQQPDERAGTAAASTDGGATWTQPLVLPGGYRSAVAWDAAARAWIAVGTNGTDCSLDDGISWRQLERVGWNALSLPWAVGSGGRIGRLQEHLLLGGRRPCHPPMRNARATLGAQPLRGD